MALRQDDDLKITRILDQDPQVRICLQPMTPPAVWQALLGNAG